MSKTAEKSNGADPSLAAKKKQQRLSQSLVPRHTLEEALRIPRALADEYGKAPTRPVDVGAAIGLAPSTGTFRTLSGASMAYGLTEGGAKADEIALTDLGRRVVAPVEEGDDENALREAFVKPQVIGDFLRKYDSSKVPSTAVALNVVEAMGVPSNHAEHALRIILTGAESLGLLRDINGTKFVNLRGVAPSTAVINESDGSASGAVVAEEVSAAGPERPAPPTSSGGLDKKPRPNVLFVGHGRNKKPLSQLTKMLDQLGIPHKVAADEPNLGRPISTKVRETMGECGAAILIFTADREYRDTEGDPVWLSSENVANELGAASVMYDDRVIIFKEDGVELASNYSGVGYITFEKDMLDAKVPDLLKELVAMKILKVSMDQE